MPLPDNHLSIRGLVLGPATVYRWTADTKLHDLDVRTASGGPRAWRHGTWSGAEWADEKTVVIELVIDAGTAGAALDALDALNAAFAPVGDAAEEIELRYRIGDRERIILGRPRGVHSDTSAVAAGVISAQCGFVAPTPFRYASPTTTDPLSPPTYSGGLTFPIRFGLRFPSVLSGGTVTVTNAGTSPAGVLATITGPCLDPRVVVTPVGAEPSWFTVAVALPAGEVLVVDTSARTVLLGEGRSNRRGDWSGTGWPLLPPGDSEIAFRSSDGSGALQVRFASTWW